GQASQVASWGSHSAGMRKPSSAGRVLIIPAMRAIRVVRGLELFYDYPLRQTPAFQLSRSLPPFTRVCTMSPTKTILGLGPDPEILSGPGPLLQTQGYRVLTATDGNTGLAAAEREAPDLVILDMMMPRTSGFLVLEKLKHRPTPGPRVIMITANEGAKHRAYA